MAVTQSINSDPSVAVNGGYREEPSNQESAIPFGSLERKKKQQKKTTKKPSTNSVAIRAAALFNVNHETNQR